MEDAEVRGLIRAKLADGRLPRVAVTHVWGGSGDGRLACAACDETIAKNQLRPVFRLPTNDGGA